MKVSKTSLSNWFATGFFLGDQNFVKKKYLGDDFSSNFEWSSNPRNISLDSAVSEFSNIFESIIEREIKGKNIILPLSGGLDSRTLAASLKDYKNVVVISYEFEGGLKETGYAQKIAKVYDWKFHKYQIKSGYLWDKLETLSNITKCQTEFTHPRQMAIIDEISDFGDVFLSGQWGDVLFNSYGMNLNDSISKQILKLIKLISKPGGIELSKDLWDFWGLDGDFETSFYQKIKSEYDKIHITEPNAKIRAFKSLQWAPRWANSNLKVFSYKKDIILPYYDKSMLEFISSVPEKILDKRKIQIEYIKNKSRELSLIPWQHYDLNLYQYQNFNSLYLPRRVFRYTKRLFKEIIMRKNKIIQRNWELQFIGRKNENNLKKWLFETEELKDLVPIELITKYYKNFKTVDPVKYSHPISMLLTLAVWSKFHWKKK